jgi:hypothetical protein
MLVQNSFDPDPFGRLAIENAVVLERRHSQFRAQYTMPDPGELGHKFKMLAQAAEVNFYLFRAMAA